MNLLTTAGMAAAAVVMIGTLFNGLPSALASDPAAAAASPTAITTVHYVTACHLDVGFRYTAPDIVNLWWHSHLPNATKIAAQLEAGGYKSRMRFTAQAWVIWLFLNCPAGNTMGLQCPTQPEVDYVVQGIKSGAITWHAFPFNSEMEMYAPEFIRQGINLAHSLDDKFGFPRKVTLSQRDVPGTTRSLVPLMVNASLQAISVGVNGASTPPNVPQAFVWRDEPSGTDVLAMWHPGGYGGIDAKSIVTVPGLSHALVMDWNGDNAGPYSAETFEKHWASVQEMFPQATLVASTFDNFTAQLQTVRNALPVVTSEIGDTGMYGCPSDPGKVAHMRAMNRAWTRYAATPAGAARNTDAVYLNATRLALKAGEHTWGLDVKSYLKDNVNWTNSQFHTASAPGSGVDTQYSTLWQSWQRQYNWSVTIPVSTLASAGHPLAAELAEEFRMLTPSAAPNPPAMGFTQVSNLSTVFANGNLRVGFDKSTGAMSTLIDTSTGVSWASRGQPLMALRYITYDSNDVTNFIKSYLTTSPPPSWAFHDFGKPNVSLAKPKHMELPGSLHSLWVKSPAASITGEMEVLLELTVADPASGPAKVAHMSYGAPAAVWLHVHIPSAGSTVSLNATMYNKTATRLPEAMLLVFRPPQTNSESSHWELNKLGGWLNATDVVDGGAKHLHSVQNGFRLVSEDGHSLSIAPIDAGIVCVGRPGGYPTPTHSPANVSEGVSSLLWDNLWGTNYVMWAGKQPSEPNGHWGSNTDLKFRYSITLQ